MNKKGIACGSFIDFATMLILVFCLGFFVCNQCSPQLAGAEIQKIDITTRNNLAKVLLAEDCLGYSWEGMLDVLINRKRTNETIWDTAKRSCSSYYRRSPAWRSLQNPNGYEKIRIKHARKIVDRKLNNLLTGKRIDSIKGGTHWENIKRFGVPYWAKDMKITAKQGSHTFYKEKK